ncbi:TetR family transcriptional regulator [Paenibacillus sp. CAA11]|uniref:TetR/AcrR family transcriptional regulator n=1 Tax=Paenibacillus sp. CAA11 TaxID=1532905 RepID=UPI000D359D4C|nr:TetR/AcrR family transcriptional regulator [Paenibacillus sp. CAA11]AWB44620.1 TetR family transcriptional regulator [Paenibacillus sp. CAA11]
MNKKQLLANQTKNKIAAAAKTLFAQKGYKGTSIEDIVAATNCSKGNIYYHFKSKEGLFLHLLEEWDIEWEQQWYEKEAKYASTRDKLFALAELLIEDDFNHPLTKAADEFLYIEDKTGDVDKRYTEMLMSHVEFYKKLLQEGINQGEIKSGYDVSHLAILLEGLWLGLTQIAKRTIELSEALAMYRTAIRVILDGIFNEDSRQS